MNYVLNNERYKGDALLQKHLYCPVFTYQADVTYLALHPLFSLHTEQIYFCSVFMLKCILFYVVFGKLTDMVVPSSELFSTHTRPS